VWQRIRHPELYSVKIGTAQRGIKLRVTLEEACLIQAPPRQGKTAALLADIVLRYPGPAVSTSVKPDVFAMTSGVRYKLGPVEVFNPQNVGGCRMPLSLQIRSDITGPGPLPNRAVSTLPLSVRIWPGTP
jgi:type IV secretory pathway TraG/TraD family ATPase VirD4